MQRPDEKKRALITATAARLFASQPYHKVRLDDIAAAARIGKGTLYVYFDTKEDLYFSLIYDGFSQLVERLRAQLEPDADAVGPGRVNGSDRAPTAVEWLRTLVRELVRFAFAHPHYYELMRTVGRVPRSREADWDRKRSEYHALVEQTIRRGVEAGELDDPHPELTAMCIGGMLRSIMTFGPKGLGEDAVAEQLIRVIERGVVRRPQHATSSSRGDA